MRLDDLNPDQQRSLLAAAGVADPPKRKPSARQDAVDRFAFHTRAYRLPTPERELCFAKHITHRTKNGQIRGRQWRFDFAWPAFMVAVEIEGLVVAKLGGRLVVTGRHATIDGMREDMRKYAVAAELGWYVIRFEQSMVKSAEAIGSTQRVLTARGWSQ